jgi:hypothetical protein
LDEYVQGWNPAPEAAMDYTLGTDWNPPDRGNRVLAEIRWRYGNITSADASGFVAARNDNRLGGRTSLFWPAGPGGILVEAVGEGSLMGRPPSWNAAIGYRRDAERPHRAGTAVRVFAGTEDVVLGSGIPGLRSATPIMGVGVDAEPAEGLVVETMVYTDIDRGFGGVRIAATYNRPPGRPRE